MLRFTLIVNLTLNITDEDDCFKYTPLDSTQKKRNILHSDMFEKITRRLLKPLTREKHRGAITLSPEFYSSVGSLMCEGTSRDDSELAGVRILGKVPVESTIQPGLPDDPAHKSAS